MPIQIPRPDLQLDFAASLFRLRDLCLLPALREIAGRVDIKTLDVELSKFAPKAGLARLASEGLRGETAFCTPLLLQRKPELLGYYRLLLGFSQKSFFTTATGLSKFKSLEKGRLNNDLAQDLPELCVAINKIADYLISRLPPEFVHTSHFNELTLLTLGAQLRGGANVRKGKIGIERVFSAIYEIVGHAATDLTTSSTIINLQNSAGRQVRIEFAADPDIIIREKLSKDRFRNVIAIEVKAGTDFSNIHNRIGEAEKSHQKAKRLGYTEFWTIVNVDNVNLASAKCESPTTTIFYRMSQLERKQGQEYTDFKARILHLSGLPESE